MIRMTAEEAWVKLYLFPPYLVKEKEKDSYMVNHNLKDFSLANFKPTERVKKKNLGNHYILWTEMEKKKRTSKKGK